jgi:hypothetical protein
MEIKASELRIGNYYNHNEEIRQVTPNTILDVWESEREWCKPIPINEEWIEKFGFQLFDYEELEHEDFPNFFYKSYKIYPRITKRYYYAITNAPDGKFDFTIKVEFADEILITSINYVHQLQNLYFALTNNELTWK